MAAWHNHKIRRLDPATGMVEAVVSGKGPGFTGDGMPALGALMNQPKAVVFSHTTGAAYVADTRNFRVRRIDTDRRHQHRRRRRDGRLRGRRRPAAVGAAGVPEAQRQPGAGRRPGLDAQDRLYIVDTENQRIRRVDFAANVIETVAGNGTAGFSGDGGPATEASLTYPRDAAIGRDGRLYIADTDNHRVRAVDLTSGDHHDRRGQRRGALRRRRRPADAGVAEATVGDRVRRRGNLYIADTFNNRIRKVMP